MSNEDDWSACWPAVGRDGDDAEKGEMLVVIISFWEVPPPETLVLRARYVCRQVVEDIPCVHHGQ